MTRRSLNISCILLFFLTLGANVSATLWYCQSDEACRSLQGSYCTADGNCECPVGQHGATYGTICAEFPAGYLSSCHNQFQCERLVSGYDCSRFESDFTQVTGSVCQCRAGHHYHRGRCWPTVGYGEECAVDEECLHQQLNDVNSMSCSGTCHCANGYYLRQRNECRKIGYAPGDGCTLNADCQFENGACDYGALQCYDTTVGVLNLEKSPDEAIISLDSSSLSAACSSDTDCSTGLECSRFNHCMCPAAYFSNGTQCFAHLGSPSNNELCDGFLSEVRDGECTCPVNFYFDVDMRNCIKATLRFNDSCVTDSNCYTFGAASYCGEPTEPWGFRHCECRSDISVKDETQEMCRLFSALGEICESASDCLAGNVEVLCIADSEGVSRCACPDGLEAVDGLCLTRGLVLGDPCQVSEECTGSNFLQCSDNFVCECQNGYFGNSGVCLPGIGGICESDGDCLLEGTACTQNVTESICVCTDGYVEYEEQCYQVSSGINESCSFSSQCTAVIGDGGYCLNGTCQCAETHIQSSGICFEKKGLGSECTTSGECYVEINPEYAICRNGICQCDFDFPYDEQLRTCGTSSANHIVSTGLVAVLALYYLFA